MRHYSVCGDIKDSKTSALAILLVDEYITDLINMFYDTKDVLFMYALEEEKSNLFITLTGENHNFESYRGLLLFDNISSSNYTYIDLKKLGKEQITEILNYLSSQKNKVTIDFINPLKKESFVENICKWIKGHYVDVPIHKGKLIKKIEPEKKRYYALDNEERELLIKLLSKASATDIKYSINLIKERRRELITNYETLGEYEQADILRQEIDDLVIEQAVKIGNECNWDPSEEFYRYPFLENFEEQSKNLIKSCFLTERAVTGKVDHNFDYTLCSSGYWRAVEIELNLTIVDALRYLYGVIDKLPPKNHISYVRGPIMEKSGEYFDFDSKSYKDSYVNINKKDSYKTLKAIMFGPLTGLSKYYNENNVVKIFDKVNEVNPEANLYEKLSKYIINLELKVYEIRNRCSHSGSMNKDEFIGLKNVLFDKDSGIFVTISEMKKAVYSPDFLDIRR